MGPRTLATLVAIAETGSFARAAERLNMTLSAVSMQMKALEAELGVALFDRAFRPPQPTPIGRAVVAHARRVLAAQDDLLRLCRTDTTLAGDYRIGFVLTASVRLLPAFLARARAAFPQATFTVETGLSDDLLGRVAAGDLDAAVVTGGEAPPDGIHQMRLTTEEMVYCLPREASDASIADCMERMAFVHFMPHAGIGRLIARHLRAAGLHPRETIVLDTVEAVAECVRAGVGFAILPAPDVARYARGEIVLRSMTDGIVVRHLVLATRTGTSADACAPDLARQLVGAPA